MAEYRVNFFLLTFVLSLAPYSLSWADQVNNPLQYRLQLLLAKTDSRQKAIDAGRERALLCSYCHGEDGNSIKHDVPNLAGQNPGYLLEQIGRFARGERKDYVMNSLARNFTEQDQINLAIYYATKKVRHEQYEKEKANKGRAHYLKQCASCHGRLGRGNAGYARLAGQRQAYIIKTLTRFKTNASGGADQKRRSVIMEPIARDLTEQDIQNLAAYLASLP